ncbi:PilZ domain-containing protein [Desulfobacterota bacterium M19]
MNGEDKRQSVRVDSRIMFAAHQVSKDDFLRIKQDLNNGISLYERPELSNVRTFVGARAALERLRERDADMADFLHHMDAKLNVLLKKVDSSPSLLDTLTLQGVNIAGNGLAFWSAEKYIRGNLLEFYIVFPADNTFIDCFGEVVECQPGKAGKEGSYRVSCHFKLIMEKDREEIIQYNFKQQGLALQRRRLEGT